MPSAPHRRGRWSWTRSFLWSVVLGTIIFLSGQPQRQQPALLPAVPTPHADWTADFPTRVDRVTAALAALPWPLPVPAAEPQGAGALRWTHRRYTLTIPQPAAPDALDRAFAPVRRAARDVTVDVHPTADGAQVEVGIDGLLTHTLVLHWLGHRPRVALIIDDLGNDLQIAHAFAVLDVPLTLAVMPFRPFSKQVAELAGIFRREVIVHLPMEADSEVTFGAQVLLRADAGQAEIQRVLDASLASVPHAVGANNHMGSRFTPDRQRMQWVLARLHQKHLFFVDSRTTPHSVACDVAATLSLPCAGRDVFLDDVDSTAAVRAQLATLVRIAQARGDGIAIGHPRPNTLAALQAALPQLRAGVEVVPVSIIVADRASHAAALSQR